MLGSSHPGYKLYLDSDCTITSFWKHCQDLANSNLKDALLFYPPLFKGQVMVMPPFKDKVIYLLLAKDPARQVNSLYWAHSSSGCSLHFQEIQHGLLWVTLCLILLSPPLPPPNSNLNVPVQLPDRRSVPPWVRKGSPGPCYGWPVLLFTRRFTGRASTNAQRVVLIPNLT